MKPFSHAFYLFLFPYVVAAALVAPKDSPDLCAKSCENSLKLLRYDDVKPTASALRQACSSRLALSSIYLCLDLNCGAETRDSTLQHLNVTCYESFGSSIPAFKMVYTDEEIAGLKRISKNDSFSPESPSTEVVVPSPDWFRAWFNTLVYIQLLFFLSFASPII